MPPTQQTPTTVPNLDFILQSEQPKPKRFGRGDKTQRILLVTIVGIVLVILVFVFLTFVRSGSRRGSAELIDLAAYQTELARVMDIGVKDSSDSSVQGVAQTGSLTITSDLIRTKKMIASKSAKIGKNDLGKYVTKSIDADLEAAKTANEFDAVFTALIDEKLGDYKTRLASVFAAQSDAKIQNTLRNFKSNAELLPFSYPP